MTVRPDAPPSVPAVDTTSGTPPPPDRALRATTVGTVLVVTLIAFEAISVATALPSVVKALDGLAYYGWPFIAFLVTSVLGMVLGGELSDRDGPTKPLVGGLLVFAGGLVVSGAAFGMVQFVAGRAVQGLGAGVVIVALYVVIGEAYSEDQRPRLFGMLSGAWVLPSLLGPLVAGTLTEHLTWRWVFLGIVPLVGLGLLLILPGLRRLPPRQPVGRQRRTRWPYALLAGAGISTLLYAGQRHDLLALGLAVVAVAALVPAVRVLLPDGTVRARRGLPAVIALRGIGAGAFFAVDAFVPLTLSEVHGYSPTAAGLPLTVGALGWASAAWWQGRHPDVPRQRLIATGMALVAVAALVMAAVAFPSVPGALSYLVWLVAGLGMGLVMPSVGVLVLNLSEATERGRNSAALQIADVLASAVCVGFGGVLVAAAVGGAFGLSPAVAAVDLAMVALAVLGAVLAGRVKPGEQAATTR